MERCPNCGTNKGELAGYGKDQRPIYYPHDPGDIQCCLNQKDAQLAALTQRAEQAERERDIYRRGAKWSGELFCWCIENLDNFVQLEGDANDEIKRRLKRLKATENVLDQETARAEAAEAEVKRLREEVDDARIYITTEDGSKLHIRNLIRCGLRSLRKKRGVFWGSVADAFGIGSTSAHRLCRFVNLDPDTGELAKEAPDAQ